MPGGDRTGPEGYGSRTGRSLGYCAGYSSPGFTKGVPRGRGFGRGWGRGFGRGGYYPPEPEPVPYYRASYPEPSREEEKHYLEETIKGLEEELKVIKERLQGISKEKKESP
jgi:hypothetical protein